MTLLGTDDAWPDAYSRDEHERGEEVEWEVKQKENEDGSAASEEEVGSREGSAILSIFTDERFSQVLGERLF